MGWISQFFDTVDYNDLTENVGMPPEKETIPLEALPGKFEELSQKFNALQSQVDQLEKNVASPKTVDKPKIL